MQENIRNLRGYALLKNPTEVLQRVHQSIRLQAHPLLEIEGEDRTVIEQSHGCDVHAGHAPERPVQNVAGEVVP